MKLGKAVNIALDETRLLILGAQVLLGFQFQVFFREPFANASSSAKLACELGLVLMAATVGLLVAPSMQHRIVERGDDSSRLVAALLTLLTLLTLWYFWPAALRARGPH